MEKKNKAGEIHISLENLQRFKEKNDGRYAHKSHEHTASEIGALERNNENGTPVATYFLDNTQNKGGTKIRLPFNTSNGKMVAFTVRLYQSYQHYDVKFSGYLYSATNQWHDAKVSMINGSGGIRVVMGRDSDGRAYVWLAGGDYRGVGIFDVVGGYSHADWNNGWEISISDEIPDAAIDTAVYPPYSLNNKPTLSDIGALSVDHGNNSDIHKNWGYFSTNGGQDFMGRGKRCIVALESGDMILNYGNDFPWVTCQSNFRANAVYNAVWNDYAEFFPKDLTQEYEAGDLISLKVSPDEEVYYKSGIECDTNIIGVYSDEYGHLIGGDEPPEGVDFVEYNLKKFIPIGLAGRVRAKITGKIEQGDFVVSSKIPGVGRKYVKGQDEQLAILGLAVESKDSEEISRIRIKIK